MVEDQRDPTTLDGLLPTREELNSALLKAEDLLERQEIEIIDLRKQLASINNNKGDKRGKNMFVCNGSGPPSLRGEGEEVEVEEEVAQGGVPPTMGQMGEEEAQRVNPQAIEEGVKVAQRFIPPTMSQMVEEEAPGSVPEVILPFTGSGDGRSVPVKSVIGVPKVILPTMRGDGGRSVPERSPLTDEESTAEERGHRRGRKRKRSHHKREPVSGSSSESSSESSGDEGWGSGSEVEVEVEVRGV